MNTSKRILTALAIGLIAAGANAQSHLKFNFREVGGDVVATTSGTVDTSTFVYNGPNTWAGGLESLGGQIWGVSTGGGSGEEWTASGFTLLSGTAVLTPTYQLASSTSDTGSIFGIVPFASVVILPTGYTSGTLLSSSSTFAGQTLSSLNLVSGGSVFGYGAANANTITVQVGGSAVPEPGEWAAMGVLGLGLSGLVLRKRRKS